MAIFGPPDALTARGAGGVQASAVPEVPPATGLRRPVIVGHLGSPGYRPDHTAAGYELAIELGADVIEPDVVVSRDGALVTRRRARAVALHRHRLPAPVRRPANDEGGRRRRAHGLVH